MRPARAHASPVAVVAIVSLVIAQLILLWPAALQALAAGPTPTPTPTPCPCTINLTGHWASPVDAGGIDIVQAGSKVRGHSLSDISFSGAMSGWRVDFTFWRGASYAGATDENRGTGSMAVATDGKTLQVTWKSGSGKGQFNGSFVLVKVGPPANEGEPLDAFNAIGPIADAIAPFLPPAASPSPGAPPAGAVQHILDSVMPALNLQLPPPPAPVIAVPSPNPGATSPPQTQVEGLTPEQQATQNGFYNQTLNGIESLSLPGPAMGNTPAQVQALTSGPMNLMNGYHQQVLNSVNNVNAVPFPDPPRITVP